MANAPQARSQREFCSTCGFPVRGVRCDACGAAQDAHEPIALGHEADEPRRRPSRIYSAGEGDPSGLERAVEAFRARDLARSIELVLAAEGGAARAVVLPDGNGWVATTRGATLFLSLRGDELTLEAPLARLSQRRRLPALRVALELCAQHEAGSRACLRGELLLLRFAARASLLAPHLLRQQLRELASLAARYSGLLTAACDVLPPFLDEQRGAATFELIGRPRRIQVGTRRSIPPPAPPASGERASGRQPVESAESHNPPVRPAIPKPSVQPAPIGEVSKPLSAPAVDSIPPVLAPMFSAPAHDALPRDLEARPSSRTPKAAGTESQRRPTMPEQSAVRPSVRGEVELPGFSRRPSASSPGLETAPRSSADPSLAPQDRLCALLRQARSLASLTLEERPASLGWVVRSTVYRAVYHFRDTLPDAVACLYRATGVVHDAASPRTGELMVTEPVLMVMERIIVARGQVAREAPLQIEPLTSAAQAKDHVARFLLEIDRAPGDPTLRHFLALGALTELLVRTKLPPQTDQRLRDIVAHAQREGAKAAAIDLMMTALQRINA